MVDENRVEAIAKVYSDSSDGDWWNDQSPAYRKQIRRMVRYVLALNEKMNELSQKKGHDDENGK